MSDNVKEIAKNRRIAIYAELKGQDYEHDLVHVNIVSLSNTHNVNRLTISNDIKFLVQRTFLTDFIPEASIYKINRNINFIEDLPAVKNKKTNLLAVDDKILNDNFTEEEKQAIKEFINFRREAKKPLTSLALKKLINRLIGFKQLNSNIVENIDTAIISGWSNVYDISARKKSPLSFKEKDEINRIADLERDRAGFEAIDNILENGVYNND